MSSPLNRAWLAFSLASMVIFPYWTMIFSSLSTPFDSNFLNNHYFSTLTDNHIDYLAAIIVTAILAVVIYVFLSAVGHRGRPAYILIIKLMSAGLMLYALNGLRIYTFQLDLALPNWLPVSLPMIGRIGILVVAISMIVFFRRLQHVIWAASYIFAPIGIVMLLNFGYAIAKLVPEGDGIFVYDKTLRPLSRIKTANRKNQRVLWMIFDEMDQRLSFDERPASVKMPVLDRYRATSFYASAAYPPTQSTPISIPSLTTGRLFTHFRAGTGDEMYISAKGEKEFIPWSKQPNIFRTMAERGINTAILGRGASYCRLFYRWINACWERESWWKVSYRTVWNRMGHIGMMVLSHVPLAYRLLGLSREQVHHRIANADAYLRFLAAAKRTVSNPAYDFIFIHWNHPHKPFFYDRFKDDFVDRPETDSGYIDQLELVDRTLGEIETALRDNDLWDSTMIIISADHDWRRSTIYDGKFDLRVPMVIKLAGQKRPFIYRKRLETIHTHRLVKAAFAGRLAGPEDIAPVMRGDAPRN